MDPEIVRSPVPPSESSMEKGAATVEKGRGGEEATSQLRIFRAYVALIGGDGGGEAYG